ncbi:oxidoreductase, partial [Rhodococcus wratislaviensis IFP 2016]
EGFCGACETKVLEGVPEHHDSILSDAERASCNTMMICVGRARSGLLVLDL